MEMEGISENIKKELIALATKYETEEFLNGDPSWFMHQVEDKPSQEVLAFVASSLSYGSRSQFLPKIQWLLDCSMKQDVTFYEWVKGGGYAHDIHDDTKCFYRLYTNQTMLSFLRALQEMLLTHSTIKSYVLKTFREKRKLTALDAIEIIVSYFSSKGIEVIIPKNTKSSCKRLCMFLRWMARDASPVDLGLWSDIIDKRSLIIPMDTHVIQEANRLGLIHSRTTSMSAAIKLTDCLKTVFPNDPLKGDFALFGVGAVVNE